MSEQVLNLILQEVQGLNVRFGIMEEDIRELKSDVRQLKSDVSELKSDVSELKSEVSQLKSDVSELKSDVSMLKADNVNLHAGQAELRQMFTALKHGQELTNAKLEALTLDVRHLEGVVVRATQEWKTEMMEMRGDIRFLNQRIANVEMDVERLKNR